VYHVVKGGLYLTIDVDPDPDLGWLVLIAPTQLPHPIAVEKLNPQLMWDPLDRVPMYKPHEHQIDHDRMLGIKAAS
jgi:hypothetical protein